MSIAVMGPVDHTEMPFGQVTAASRLGTTWNDRNQFAVEPSKLTVWIAPDSAHGTPAQADIVP